MNKELEKTEKLIKTYKENQVKENLKALLLQVERTAFLVPATLPADVDREELKKRAAESDGAPTKLPEGVTPIPCMMKNKDGKFFLPIFTTRDKMTEEIKFEALMTVPFVACADLAEKFNTEGILLNPFTDNLFLEKALLTELLKEQKANRAGGGQNIKVTPQQFQAMMRQKAEFHDFPSRVFKEGAEFIQLLSDEQEKVVNEIYLKAFQDPKLYPYGESDFSVMPLNISEDLLLVRVDVPAIKVNARLCERIYVTLNPKNDEVHYFTIERGQEKGQKNICEINAEGKQIMHGEAPVEGAEIQRVMDLIKGGKEVTS